MTQKSAVNPLHILHVTPAYYPATYWGGPIFSVYGLNNALAALPEVDLCVLTTDTAGKKLRERLHAEELDEKKLYPGYKVIFARRILRNSTSLELLFKLPSLIKWADVVHLTATYSFPTIPVLLLSRIFGRPLIWSPRGALLGDEKFPYSRNRAIKYIWNLFLGAILQPGKVILHTTSKEEFNISRDKFPRLQATMIPNGVDLPVNYSRKKIHNTEKLNLLYLGRLTPIKGIENLLDAISILDDPQVTLSIFGSGEPAYTVELQARAKQAGLLDGRVKFHGHAEYEEKTAAFQDADVFILPSHSENFGMAIAEALAHSVPVIASRETPWKDLEAKRCGLWVANDPHSLAESIKTIRKMDLTGMGKNGHQWMKNEYSWDVLGMNMLDLYRKMIRQQKTNVVTEEL
jgi:glycosyltransferase involved in cell wall biosynthesis